MSFGRSKKPCDEFRYWPNNSVCGKCAWPEDLHGTDAEDNDVGEEVALITQSDISILKLSESKKYERRNGFAKHRNKMTHLTPKKKKRK